MKNKFKYIVLPGILVICLLFLAAYGQRLPFGSAYWKDSLVNGISTNKSIYLQSGDSIYYNGTVVTSGTGGGGIAASDNITFSGYNIFSGITKHTNGTYFTDSLNVTGAILKADSIRVSKYLNLATTQLITIGNVLYLSENAYQFNSSYGNGILTLDSSSGLLLNYGYYSGVGSGLTALNASNISSGTIDTARIPNTAKIDTAKFFRLGDIVTPITEVVNSLVTFSTTVTFTVSPVFSALVNFANGVTVTGTATFNGDLVPTSWVKTQSSVTKDQYIKDKFVRLPISTSTSAGTVTYALHGVGRTSIRDFDIVIRDDSTGRFAKSGNIGLEGGSWAQGTILTWGLNDTAVWFRRTANAYNFIGDTAFFHIIYADTTR